MQTKIAELEKQKVRCEVSDKNGGQGAEPPAKYCTKYALICFYLLFIVWN